MTVCDEEAVTGQGDLALCWRAIRSHISETPTHWVRFSPSRDRK